MAQQTNRLEIERVQKSAFHVILGEGYKSYSNALKLLKMETLFRRRQKLCLTFAKKCQKNEKFSTWFKVNDKKTKTRQEGNRLCDVYSRTMRFENSPISYITRLLNRVENTK